MAQPDFRILTNVLISINQQLALLINVSKLRLLFSDRLSARLSHSWRLLYFPVLDFQAAIPFFYVLSEIRGSIGFDFGFYFFISMNSN